jgi:hypothetical protein
MNFTHTSGVLALGLVLAPGHASQAAPATPVTVIRAVTAHGYADGKAIRPSSTFSPKDHKIYCVLNLNRIATTQVTLVWIAVKAGGTTNYTLLEKALPKKVINRANGSVSFSKDWPTGSYKVLIKLDGKLAKSVPFTIK